MVAGGHTLQEKGRRALYPRGKEQLVNKRTLLYLSIAAIVLIIVGIILGPTTSVIGGILTLLGLIALFLSWVMGLLFTFRAKQWLWFVLIFLFMALGTLVYSLMGRSQGA